MMLRRFYLLMFLSRGWLLLLPDVMAISMGLETDWNVTGGQVQLGQGGLQHNMLVELVWLVRETMLSC